ncbi:MAG: potassium channel family protein [Actinomycetes bacterium]
MTVDKRAIFDEESRYLDRFGLLLALTVTSVVMLSLVDLSDVRSDRPQQAVALAASSLTALALLVALRAAGLARRWQRLADVLIVMGVLASALLVATGQTNGLTGGPATTPPALALVLALLAPIVVARRLLTHRWVRRETLLGAVSVYLLIAVAFFYVFLTVDLTQSSTFFAQAEPTSNLMYFSLTTITTVGYGDLFAVAQPGRLFANAEAVIGQLYLVTFVGLLIGIFTAQSRDKRRARG